MTDRQLIDLEKEAIAMMAREYVGAGPACARRADIRVQERCATPVEPEIPCAEGHDMLLTCNGLHLVPLAGLEPATCCLGDG